MRSEAAQRRPSQDIPPRTHGLWSLWELMLKRSALEFGRSMADLRMIEMSCQHLTDQGITVDASSRDYLSALVAETLGNLKRICILNNLDETIGPQLDRFLQALPRTNLVDLKARADTLRHNVYDQLNHEYYFQVDRQDVQFYGRSDLIFPGAASSKFKAAMPEIEKAGNCVALQQPDACIFHISRALEVVVRQLGRRLKVTITPQSTWRQITGAMDGKIKGMPEKNDRQKHKKMEWESARANLHHLGSIWRNKTMHPAASYSRGQAREIYDAARVVMTDLCRL